MLFAFWVFQGGGKDQDPIWSGYVGNDIETWWSCHDKQNKTDGPQDDSGQRIQRPRVSPGMIAGAVWEIHVLVRAYGGHHRYSQCRNIQATP